MKIFLGRFFEEEIGNYNHQKWVTFQVPHGGFLINLMEGKDQPLTQNLSIEVYCDSLEQLQEFAKTHNTKIYNFTAEQSSKRYQHHYIEIAGPQEICKLEISFSEDL
ncbi:MAG: hypothetical protein WD153_02740 [Candidatus Paceibacterota bacterium]